MSFADTPHRLQGGIEGELVELPTRSPMSYQQAIADPGSAAAGVIDGQLFIPVGAGPWPVVTVIPGSLGVAPSHLVKADYLTEAGIAAFVIDPFGRRGVTSTVANQAQYSFAASAWDVLAATALLVGRRDIDSARIGAQGHSRGGSAVLAAATLHHLSSGVTGPMLCGAYAAYPWSGQQFLNPRVGKTAVRSVIGSADEWCSPTQVQAHMHAMRLTGADASFKLFENAQHSFDRDTPVELIADASVAPGAPIAYMDDAGVFIHPLAEDPDPSLTEVDLMRFSVKSGAGRRGARIGSAPGEADAFHSDMLTFWTRVLSA